MNFYMPVKLYTGTDCVENHKEVLQTLGKKCLLVTGASSAKRCGALDDVERVLTALGIEYTLYDRIGSNPKVELCQKAGEQGAAFGAEFVIGIGGGSPLDAAKAAAVFSANPGMTEETFYGKAWSRPPLPVVLIGTTAGTGSEVTKVSVLTDSKKRKHSIHDDRLFAIASFGDPGYTLSLPQNMTLSTGIDVLAHCVESYFNRKANAVSRTFAVKGIRMLMEPLQLAAKGNPLRLEERAQLYDASIFGGLAICITGTCFPHNVGYYLTENYGVPHGFASAVFLPELLEYAAQEEPKLTERFFSEIGCEQRELLEQIEQTLPEFSFRLTSEEIKSVLPRWEDNNSVKATIGTVSKNLIRACLEKLK